MPPDVRRGSAPPVSCKKLLGCAPGPSSGLVWRSPVFIPKGFKLIAVGEHCATPTDTIDSEILTLKGSHFPSQFDPFRVRTRFVDNSVAVAQSSPTAINLNPFGIGSDRNS